MDINDAATEDVRCLKTIETKACSVSRMKPNSSEQGKFFASSQTRSQAAGTGASAVTQQGSHAAAAYRTEDEGRVSC